MGGINYFRRNRAALTEAEDAESSWEELPTPPTTLPTPLPAGTGWSSSSSSSAAAAAGGTSWGKAMLGAGVGAGAKPAKPSFVSYISPEVRRGEARRRRALRRVPARPAVAASWKAARFPGLLSGGDGSSGALSSCGENLGFFVGEGAVVAATPASHPSSRK